MGKYVVGPKCDGKLKTSLDALEAAKELFMFALQVDNQAILLKIQEFLHRFTDDWRLFQDETSTNFKRIHVSTEETGREIKRFRQDSAAFQSNATDRLARLEENVSKMASTLPVQATATLSSLPEEQKQNPFLESLKFNQIDSRQSSIRNAHTKTCKWVLDNLKYKDWLDSGKLSKHCGFIWFQGKPGAGKSTLMKFLLFQAKTTMKNTTIISFFFNARGGDLEKSTTGMYRSLLYQLLKQQPQLQEVLESTVRATFNNDEYEWSLEPLKAVTQVVIRHLSQASLVCFIDALDECDEDEIRDMISFFPSLGELATSMKIEFRVCFSSRDYPQIKFMKGLNLRLDREKGHAQDIITYMDSVLNIGNSSLAQIVRRELQRKAQGVFMWAVLVVGILNKEYDHGNVPELWNRLQDIPDDLHELFRRILNRDDERKDRLLLCVKWVLFTREPLKPEQLYFAIFSESQPEMLCKWDPDEVTLAIIERFLISSSKGLVEVTQSIRPTVQFIHESVKDFLLKSNGLQELWPDLGSDFEVKSHNDLKKCCLNQLRVDVIELLGIKHPFPPVLSREGEELRQSTKKIFPFLEYAIPGVLYHTNLAEAGGISQTDFLEDFKFQLTNWVLLKNLLEEGRFYRYGPEVSLLYILAELNCAALIQAYSFKQSCFEVEDSQYGSPLLAAFATQSKGAVSALLEAEVQSQPGNELLQNLARKYFCLERNCIPLTSHFEFAVYKSTLCVAAAAGDLGILEFILSSGEHDIEFRSRDGNTAVMLAAESGHKAAVELLIKKGANMELSDDFQRTPLLHAAIQGHDEIDKVLLAMGADLEAKDGHGSTSLIAASRWGNETTCKLLLDQGPDIEARDKEGRTALMCASEKGFESIVMMLLEKGASIEAKDTPGRTPLMIASMEGMETVVRTLLENGADTEAQDMRGRTALMLGMHYWYVSGQSACKYTMELLLLENGANIEAKGSDGITSLVYASRNGREGAVKVLLDNGARIDTRDLSQYMPAEGSWDGAYQRILKEAKKLR
ncbi:hypothetical protein QBC37DRAFT_148617 [Rhypophila decipiens]|uniref:Nephrocystin 3-like N-terminal domain-containing protein n=1 Tax=Rhypophila decipiens TaxID=261697 RepID=A0AAN7B8Q4_9PEZI|nr:hypothetical protein QBC37DRAFT_148617 [Rhypophila decipiens]